MRRNFYTAKQVAKFIPFIQQHAPIEESGGDDGNLFPTFDETWQYNPTVFTVANGEATYLKTASSDIKNTIPLELGATYSMTIDFSANAFCTIGNFVSTNAYKGWGTIPAGTYTLEFVCTGDGLAIRGSTGSVTNWTMSNPTLIKL